MKKRKKQRKTKVKAEAYPGDVSIYVFSDCLFVCTDGHSSGIGIWVPRRNRTVNDWLNLADGDRSADNGDIGNYPWRLSAVGADWICGIVDGPSIWHSNYKTSIYTACLYLKKWILIPVGNNPWFPLKKNRNNRK